VRQIFSLDFDDPAEIDAVRKFLQFHSKRLNCTEDKVLLTLSEEFKKSMEVVAPTNERSDTSQTGSKGKTRKARASQAQA